MTEQEVTHHQSEACKDAPASASSQEYVTDSPLSSEQLGGVPAPLMNVPVIEHFQESESEDWAAALNLLFFEPMAREVAGEDFSLPGDTIIAIQELCRPTRTQRLLRDESY